MAHEHNSFVAKPTPIALQIVRNKKEVLQLQWKESLVQWRKPTVFYKNLLHVFQNVSVK